MGNGNGENYENCFKHGGFSPKDLEILEVTKQAKQARLEEEVDESVEEMEPQPPLMGLFALSNKCFTFFCPKLTSHH